MLYYKSRGKDRYLTKIMNKYLVILVIAWCVGQFSVFAAEQGFVRLDANGNYPQVVAREPLFNLDEWRKMINEGWMRMNKEASVPMQAAQSEKKAVQDMSEEVVLVVRDGNNNLLTEAGKIRLVEEVAKQLAVAPTCQISWQCISEQVFHNQKTKQSLQSSWMKLKTSMNTKHFFEEVAEEFRRAGKDPEIIMQLYKGESK